MTYFGICSYFHINTSVHNMFYCIVYLLSTYSLYPHDSTHRFQLTHLYCINSMPVFLLLDEYNEATDPGYSSPQDPASATGSDSPPPAYTEKEKA